MDEMTKLKAEVEVLVGRVGALNAVLHVLVRGNSMPPSVLCEAIKDAARKVEADVVASPLPDRTVSIMRLTLEQLIEAAQCRADEVR